MARLLQLNECLSFSTGKITLQIGEAAVENGWMSWIAYSSRQLFVQSSSKTVKVGSSLSPYIHYAENLLFDKEGLSSRRATKRLIKKIKEICPDIVQ